ncbi:TPA: tail fiber assembly protein [Escherichia coli]
MTIYCGLNTVGFFDKDNPDLPEGAKEISAGLRDSLLNGQADGKKIDFSVFPPVLIEIELTHEDEVAIATLQRDTLLKQANEYMNDRQWPGKAAMGRLTDDEKSQYNLWLDYLDALEAVDTSSAPDINWPSLPEA